MAPLVRAASASWILLLVAAQVDAHCTTGTPKECTSYQYIPGSNIAERGFDITTMTQSRYKLFQMKVKPGQNCVVCENRHASRPFQKLPDIVTDWSAHDMCHRKVNTAIYPSSSEALSSLGALVSNDWTLKLGPLPKPNTTEQVVYAGSQSDETKFVNDKSIHDKYSFAKHEVRCSYYKFRLKHHLPLDPRFQNWLKQLEHPYNATTMSQYVELIELYGTHYLHKMELGGLVQETTALKTCELSLDGLTVDEVGDCLWSEASMNAFKEGAGSTRHQVCQKVKKRQLSDIQFSSKFSERFVKASKRGPNDGSLLFLGSQAQGEMTTWMNKLKKDPDIISYALTPLHELVNFSDRIKENLKTAISEYIQNKSLKRECPKCPGSTRPSPLQPCRCICQPNNQITGDCCPKQRGLAMLTVKVATGHDLYGDIVGQTDGFVKVCLGNVCLRTNTVNEDNFPKWDYEMNFGAVILSPNSKLLVETYDQDVFSAEILGSCTESLEQTKGYDKKICYLKHGKIEYLIKVECGPYLTGPACAEHKASYH